MRFAVHVKKCSKCKVEKLTEQFAKNSSTKDGRQGRCKVCRKKQYEQNRAIILKKEYDRRWPNGKPKFSTRIKDIVGQKFAKLTVVRLTGKKAKDGSMLWHCKCDCGNSCETTGTRLRSDSKKSCGCLFLEFYEKQGKRHKEISGAFWCSYRNHAKHLRREFSITMKEAWEIWENQNGYCALSGVQLKFAQCSAKGGFALQTASMDRIDSTLGYFKENVQWVHKEVNFMKQAHTDQKFIELITSCKAPTYGEAVMRALISGPKRLVKMG